MSTMILCRDKLAVNPLYISCSDVRLYSNEELCYYIYNNIYIITNDFISDELIHFLRYETKDMALADRVEQMKKSDAGLAAILVTILKSVDYYSISQIDKISEILSTLDSQNVYERLMSRADTYLDRKRYFKAIDCYKQIIKEYKNDAPGALQPGYTIIREWLMRVCLCMTKQPKALSWLMKQDSIPKVMMLIWQQNILTKETKNL